MNNPTISKIRIYPIKSLGYVDVLDAEIGVHALKYDRQFAMVDENGRYFNGKRNSKVNLLQTEYDLINKTVNFTEKPNGKQRQFELRKDNAELDRSLSKVFETELKLKENLNGKFLDIPLQSSVTVISEASLKYLQKEMDTYALESMRLRFRSNIELSGIDAFWEERLFLNPGFGMRFKIGNVTMIGIDPRARCNVPPQDPDTGEMDYYFVKKMMQIRQNHAATIGKIEKYGRAPYFIAVNVYLPKTERGKKISVNDKIEIIEPIHLNLQSFA